LCFSVVFGFPVFRWLGYRPIEIETRVPPDGSGTVDAALEPVAVELTELVVSAASRAPERIVEAPPAISVVEPQILQNTTLTGQAPLALQTVPGVDGAGFRLSNNFRIHGTATNVLDQERFQLFGGSVLSRRVLAELTANF
jgi:outer membrane receptor protein involved in Fe transport